MRGNTPIDVPIATTLSLRGDQPAALDTPEKIERWVLLSRMHQLGLELRTNMKYSRGPMLKVLKAEGFLDEDLVGHQLTKAQVLYACIQKLREFEPEFQSQVMAAALMPYRVAELEKRKITINFPRNTHEQAQ